MTDTAVARGEAKRILVIGGGISGITAALEAAETGHPAVLVEREAWLGGRVARFHHYFPKLCPPSCGLEINIKRLKANPRITVLTLAELESLGGSEGAYRARVKIRPRRVNEKCTACGECLAACPVERPNDFDYAMGRTKAIYLPHEMAYPWRYVIDDAVCPGAECGKCVAACPYGAIDLGMEAETIELQVGSVVVAAGWEPYDARRMDNLGYGRYPNVITNVMMERLASPGGPTGGRILRPSDGAEPARVAFVQCAGSRDENHLPYCSGVCCLASMKQATYLRQQLPDSQAHIFYIDLRAEGALEDFLVRVQGDSGIRFLKGKVAKVTEDPTTRDLTVEAEDTLTGRRVRETVQLVVLATGMVPAGGGLREVLGGTEIDENGFLPPPGEGRGIYGTGCAVQPADVSTCVQQATGAALKAIQSLVREAHHG